MKIAHLTSVHPRNDVRIYERMCVSLSGDEYDVHLVVASDEFGGFVDDLGVTIHAVKRSEGRMKRMLNTSRNVIKEALKIDADIYHLHDPELLIWCSELARKTKGRVIFDAHEDVRGQMGNKAWIPAPLRGLVRIAYGICERCVMPKLSGVITATPAIQRRYLDRLPSCAVQNYSSHDAYDASSGSGDPYFAYVGVIGEKRGALNMVEAMASAKCSAELAVAGRWDPASFRESITDCEGWERVVDKGFLSRAGVQDLLKGARAGIVLFSRIPNHVESQPNKLFEYMAAGLPVIASDFPAWRKLVVDEVGCGLCVDEENSKDIARAMDWIVEHPKEAQEMGARGREAVKDKYNWESEYRKLKEFYERISH